MLVHYEHLTPSRDGYAADLDPALACLAGPAAVPSTAPAMGTDTSHSGLVRPRWTSNSGADVTAHRFEGLTPDEAVDYIVDECFFTVGQTVGDRKSLDVKATIWWRDHYRAKFLAAMKRFGNRWMADEKHVKGVGRLLAERAIEYAGDRPSIDERAAMKAAADAERYCTLHWMRRARHARQQPTEEATWIAGYWCGDGGLINV